MATFLQQHVLATNNVTAVYALAPMTHLQTPANYPDMAALETIQQFALLNRITCLPGSWGDREQASVEAGVAIPLVRDRSARPLSGAIVRDPISTLC
jgi:hypothetical protein